VQTFRYFSFSERGNKQVRAEPPSSVLNTTLPAFATERRRLQHSARSAPAAISRYRLPAGRSTANPPAAVAAVD